MSVGEYILAIEDLLAEKDELMNEIKDLYKQAKDEGYDNKIMRKVIALRKKDEEDILEEQTVLEIYMEEVKNVNSNAV